MLEFLLENLSLSPSLSMSVLLLNFFVYAFVYVVYQTQDNMIFQADWNISVLSTVRFSESYPSPCILKLNCVCHYTSH
jgi:hypothetical protein